MEIRNLIEKPINEIWEKYDEIVSVPPIAVSEVPKNGIIFVGINPSLGEKDRLELEKVEDKKIEFYPSPSSEIEKPHPYFKKFIKVHEEVGLPWGHIDLLYIRETQQSKINDMIKDENSIHFIYEQTQVTRTVIDEIIKNANPKVFVVNNTLARGLLGRYKTKDGIFPNNIPEGQKHWIDYQFEWNDEYGTFFLKEHNIPFFFSSMFTGQRALDNGSFERLIWHMKYVLEKLNHN
jgi:predicted DNA-binding protein YlxM (UPF0122 family)